MVIKVALISKDQSIAGSCRTILAELFGPEFTLTMGFTRELVSQADLCIWDFVPGETDPILQAIEVGRLQSDLFVVHRSDVEALRDLMGSPNVNLLLKPLLPATLRAFLGEVCQRWRELDKDFAARRLRMERDEMLQCLIQANLRLQEYDQNRTTFLARSLHDFRAPLTAISGYCALLLGHDLGSVTTEQREVLGRMQNSLLRLSHMTQAMFQLSVANTVEQKLVFQQGDLRKCVEQAMQEVAPFIAEKRIAITADVDRSNLLSFDKALVERTLINLLDNASKFTPRAGAIDIKGYPYFWDRRIGQAARIDASMDRRIEQGNTPNSFRVDVHDSGPGIPVAHLDKIFEEFTSYSGGQDRSGGGLGLAICRMIVRQHRGRIWAENSPTGAVFSLVLPYQRTEAIVCGDGSSSRQALSAVSA